MISKGARQLIRSASGFDAVTAPPDGIDVPRWDRNNPYWEAVMSEIITVGLDLAKNVFQVLSVVRLFGSKSGVN